MGRNRLFERVTCTVLASLALSPACHAFPLLIEGAGDDGSSDASSNDPEVRYESWMYVSIPRFGIASLQDTLEPGTAANIAMLDVGEPIEQYEPVAVHGPTPSVNNAALAILMLPERCLGDYNDDGNVDLYDAPFFTIAFLDQDRAADLTRDGIIDIRDQMVFVALATLPCQNAW